MALVKEMLASTPSHLPLPSRLLSWAVSRLKNITANTLDKYITMICNVLKEDQGIDIRETPEVRNFTRAVRRLEGTHKATNTPAMLRDTYRKMILEISSPVNAVIVLAWHRAGRIKDILETRTGGLWKGLLDPNTFSLIPPHLIPLLLEEPWDKVGWAGLTNVTQILVDMTELTILAPFISHTPPILPPRHRPLLFPNISSPLISKRIAALAPGLTSRSIRRGVLKRLLEQGVPLESCILLSLHRSVDGATKYIERPDLSTASTLVKMQEVL